MHLQTIMHIIKILNAYQLNAYIHLTIAHMHSTKIMTCALPANQFTNLHKTVIHFLLIIYIGDNLSSTIYVLDVQEHQCDATFKNYGMDLVRIWKIAWATSKIIFWSYIGGYGCSVGKDVVSPTIHGMETLCLT